MNAYTYFEPIVGMAYPAGLLALWAASWRARGWNPIILNESTARENLGFGYVIAKLDKLPSQNPAPYERACYLRHLAMVEVGGGLLTDYDVINYGLTPEDLQRAVQGRNLLLLEPTRVPCAIWGTQEGFEEVVDLICAYVPDHLDRYHGKPHVSDMTILRRTDLPYLGLCVEAGCAGDSVQDHEGTAWLASKLVHFSTGFFHKRQMQGFDKEKLIQKVRPL